MKDEKFLNLILISSDWENSHRRGFYNHLQKQLSVWSSVVFVEAPYSLIFHLLKKFRKILKTLFSEDNQSNNGEINILRLLVLFHIRLYPGSDHFNQIDSFLAAGRLKNYVKKKYKDHKVILWVHHPSNYFIADYLNPDFLVYDYYDNFGYDSSGKSEEKILRLNEKLIKLCTLIICTAGAMYQKSLSKNKNSYFVTNGYEETVFNRGKIDLHINGEVIGYLGNIRDWIDFDLVYNLLDKLKCNQYLVFIGPVERNVNKLFLKLKQNRKFLYLEKIPFENTGSYLRSFNVGIIPFKINKFTEGVLPNKFFEYLAAKIPVVSVALPDIEQFADLVNVAYNYKEFVEYCINHEKYNKKNSEDKYDELLRKSAWDTKARQVNDLLISKIIKNEVQ